MKKHEVDGYSSELAEELELRDLPPEAVDRIVREASSHTAESREDPRDSFGSPPRYADEFAPRSRTRKMLVSIVILAAVLGAGGGLMLISGIFGFISPSVELLGLTAGARLTIGIVLITSLIALLVAMAFQSRRRTASWKL
jgi:hypothetical protein